MKWVPDQLHPGCLDLVHENVVIGWARTYPNGRGHSWTLCATFKATYVDSLDEAKKALLLEIKLRDDLLKLQ